MKAIVRSALRRANRFWVSSVASRSEYGRVWDAVSGSVGDARHAVAGYADEGEWQRSGTATAADVVAECGVTSGDVVLEIGCGAGRVGAHLAPTCREWVGADVSANMLAHARSALAGRPNVRLVQLGGDGLGPIADASVDVVYCTAVFMHLDEWDRYRYAREAFRVLRPGGRVYVDNFSLLSPSGWRLFEDLAKLSPAERPPHVSKASTPQEIEAYVRHAGFADVRVREGDLFVTVMGRKPAA
jgi:SAM-dependent methyltransferase